MCYSPISHKGDSVVKNKGGGRLDCEYGNHRLRDERKIKRAQGDCLRTIFRWLLRGGYTLFWRTHAAVKRLGSEGERSRP